MKPEPSPNSFYLSLQFAAVPIISLLLLLLGTPALFAQVDRAELEGTVTDPSGRVITGATVKTLAVDTGISEEQPTNSKGYYRFPGLAVGRYTVIVGDPGFKTKVIDDVILQVGQTHTLDIPLVVGEIKEEVEVNATNAPSERTSAAAATVITTDQIAELPNNGRDWASFTLLAPFAQDDGGGDQRTIRFAGRARDDNNFSIDGVDAGGIQEQAQKSQTRLQISQDAIEEYRVNSASVRRGVRHASRRPDRCRNQVRDERLARHGLRLISGTRFLTPAITMITTSLEILPFLRFAWGSTDWPWAVRSRRTRLFFFINYEGLRQLQSTTKQVNVPAGVCCASFPKPEPQKIKVPYQKYVLDQATSLGYGSQMCQIMQAFAWRASVGSIDGCAPRFVFPDSAFSTKEAIKT